jgi:hypothetical protein
VPPNFDRLDGATVLTEDRERDFDEWVRRRLSNWSTDEVRALDRWLVEESHFEFVTSVRRAWMWKSLEEAGRRGSEEPAA